MEGSLFPTDFSFSVRRAVSQRETFYFYGNSCLVSDIQITNLFAAELLMPYEVFRKNFFAHMNELEITPGKVRLDEAIRLIVCQMSDFLVPYVISIN